MKHLLALDQGTTSSRAIVFDERGRIVALAQKEFAQHFPRSGWVEHDPRDLWQTQLEVAREVLATAKLQARDIAALGITNQRETAVVWDRATGEPVYNAIVWQDRRTAPTCDRLKAEGYGQTFRAKSGLIIDSYFSGTKVGWILDNVAGARERAERGELAFGTVDSWIVWQLTRGRLHVTDVSNASRTMLFNIHQNDWDEELARILRVPLSMLPDVSPSASVFGHTDADLLGAPVLIGGIGGDQQSALFGQTCFEPGMAKNTYGTGCFMLLQTGSVARPSKSMLLTTSACQIAAEPPIGGRRYALEGSVFVAGAVVQWLRDGLGIIKTSSEVQQLAASVPDTGGVFFVPAFTGLGAPHWDSYARGAILGMSRGTTGAHIARAAIESIAYQSTELLQAMREDSGEALTELRVDGGAAINDMLMQFQADLLGVPVVRPKVLETTALGAAYLAGITVGVWPDLKTLSAQWEVDRRFEPTMSRVEAQHRLARWRDAVQRAKGWDKPAERG